MIKLAESPRARLRGLYDLTPDDQFRCAQIRDGYIWQSEVSPEFLYKCAINGYSGNTALAFRAPSTSYTPPPSTYEPYIPPPIEGVDRSTPDLAPGTLTQYSQPTAQQTADLLAGRITYDQILQANVIQSPQPVPPPPSSGAPAGWTAPAWNPPQPNMTAWIPAATSSVSPAAPADAGGSGTPQEPGAIEVVTGPAAAASGPADGSTPATEPDRDTREVVGGSIIDEILSALPPELRDLVTTMRETAAALPSWAWLAGIAAAFYYANAKGKRRR